MLEVDIRKRQGAFTLDARFHAGPGLTALFGPSGSGKTSIIQILSGLVRPDSGRVSFGDTVWTDTERGIHVPAHRRRIGYVFQEARLFPHMTVADNLGYATRYSAEARTGARENRTRIARLLGIEPLLARRPAMLSGGERQRVALGRALMARPRLLLMDEPLSALDQAIKAEILPDLERIRDVEGIPIVYVSHSVAEIARLATRIVSLEKGRIVGTDPVDAAAGAMVAEGETLGTFLTATVTDQLVEDGLTVAECPAGTLYLRPVDVAPGTALRLHLAASDIVLSTGPVDGLSTLNRLSGLVSGIEVHGQAVDVTVTCNGVPVLARVTRRSARSLDLAPGRPVHVLFKALSIAPDSFYRRG